MHLFLRRFPVLGGLQIFALLCAMMAGSQTLHAGTITVTTTADSGAGSLRDAIAAASDGDTIQFDAALNGQTISLTSGELAVDKDITISGPGSDLLTVSRSAQAANFRIFHVLIGRTVIIQRLTITGGFDNGGGIFNDNANLTINGCIIRDNASPVIGGGIENSGSGKDGNASLTILDSTITGNRSEIWGGGIYTAPPSEFNSATLSVTNSVVSFNQAVYPDAGYGRGGGIYAWSSWVTLNNCSVSHNNAGDLAGPPLGGEGGGIYNNAGIVTIIDSTIDNNQSGGRGGGISNTGGDGSVNLYIANSSLFGNEALGEDLGPNGEGGGAIFTFGMCLITNSTLSDNYAAVSGGGILSGSRLRIIHSTLSGNRADKDGGGISNSYAGGSKWTLDVGETILKTGSSGANIVSGGGTVTSLGYNLSDDDGGGLLTATGDQVNTEPMLGPLQDNGGPTLTHELLTGSPAIDSGNPSFTPPPANDQRGFPYLRVFNGRIDIGSLEVQPPPPTPTPSPTPTATATATATATPPSTPTPTPTPPTETPTPTPPTETPTPTPTPPAATPTPTPTATPSPSPARALNMSTRMLVETGDRVGIGGFIITGPAPKQVILRGIGPSASVAVPDALADPVMELHGPGGFATITNDNWRDTQEAEIQATGIPPTDNLESAILVTLDPGAYTAIVKGKDNTSGVGLVEVYDLGPATSQLANISTRAFVSTGDNVMIGGFILGGGDHAHIFIHAGGPSGINPTLAGATLELRDGSGTLLAFNDNCESSVIGPPNPADACIDITLPAGAYTAILAGKNGGTGIGLLEIYNLQ